MLVISRRENQSFLFPNLGISVEVLKVAGKVAKIGIDAPQDVRVLREEICDESELARAETATPTSALTPIVEALPAKLRHEMRNRLNPIGLGLQLIQKRISTGQMDELEQALESLIGQIKKLDIELSQTNSPSLPTRRRASATGASAEDANKLALIVDDNGNESSLLRELLELSGYTVAMAEDGRAALDYLSETARMPDFVLLDMNMPRMDGVETIKEIRSTAGLEELKVFAVSGAEREDLHLGIGKDGVDAWFQKPVCSRELVQAMEHNLQAAV